jgi:HSP20 family protein
MIMANPQQGQSKQGASPPQGQGAQPEQGETKQGGAQPERTPGGRATGMSRRDEPGFAALGRPFGMSPFGFVRRMLEDMDRMLEQALGGGAQLAREQTQEWPIAMWVPAVEIARQGDELVVRADLPGAREEDIRVTVEDDVLVLEGERRSEREQERGDVFRSERVYGSFRRIIPLPEGADTQNASASFEAGVLEIRIKLPEQEQRGRGRRIEVQGKGGEGAGRVH